jgi:molybdopterin synthase catalytic subunit
MSTLSPHQAAVELDCITSEPIDISKMLHAAHHPGAGGIVLFCGEVRDNQENKPVKYLIYEAHALLADKSIKEIIETAVKKWNLVYAAALHRIGKLEISECAVAVVTAHTHRKEAYSANQYIIDRIKHEAPVWKCEYFLDGTHEWGQNC